MSRDPDESVGRVREIAEAALGDLRRFLGDGATVEDVRHLWNRLLQLEHESQLGGVEGLSPKGRVASELILAALVCLAENLGATPLTSGESRRGTAEPPTDVDPTLLEAAEFHQTAAAAARDALVAAQAEIAPLEAELNRAKVRVGNAIRRLYQAGASVSSIARVLGMGEEAVDRVVGTSAVNEFQPLLVCNFCARNHKHLIAGPGVYICSECIEVAQEVGAGRHKGSTPL